MADPQLHIDVASHHFKLTKWSPRARQLIIGFRDQFIQYDWEKDQYGVNRRVEKRKYYSFTHDYREIRFHINVYKDFLNFFRLRGIHESEMEIHYREYCTPAESDIQLQPQFKDRDQQVRVVQEYLVNPEPSKRKMLPLPPGSGKSYLAMRQITILKCRACFIMRKGYIDKWLDDLPKKLIYNPMDFMIVSGQEDLMALTHLAVNGQLDAKVIMISNTTFMSYITLYETLDGDIKDVGYACYPDELLQYMGVGTRIIDEVHQDFHANCRIDMYTHVEWSLSMSGSYQNQDQFVTNMMEMVLPWLQRYHGWVDTPFIHSTAVMYRFEDPGKIQSTGFRGSYSHVRFEQSILKRASTRKNYVKMVSHYLDEMIQQDFREDDRAVLFVATVDMATYLRDELLKIYPAREIVRFCRTEKEDNLKVAMEASWIITTLMSAGTNIDFANLRNVFLLVSVDADASNIQGFGRFRDNLRPGVFADFKYFNNSQNHKQMRYYRNKELLLKPRAKTTKTINYYPLL